MSAQRARMFMLLVLLVAALADTASAAPRGATRARPGQELTHRFAEAGAQRWYRLRVRGPSVLRVASATGPTRLDVMVVDPDDAPLASGPTRWLGQQWRWSGRVEPGTVYVGLTARYTDGAPAAFAFDVLPLAAGEPADDAPEGAREVSLGEDVPVRILPAGDVDHLAVEVDRLGVLVARQVGAASAEQYLSFARAGRRGAQAHWAGADRWAAWRVRPGRHVVSVTAGAPFAEDASVRFELIPQDDATEPADTPTLASVVPLGAELPARMLPAGDVDWVAVDVPADGLLTCRQVAASDASAWPRCEAFLADGTTAVSGSSPFWEGSDRVSVFPVGAGRVLLRFGGAQGLGPLTYRIDHEARRDVTEPNDDPASAPAALGDLELRAFPPGDVDHLTVVADRPSMLRVTELPRANRVTWRASLGVDGAAEDVSLPLRPAREALGEVRGARVATRVVPAGRHRITLRTGGWSREPQPLRVELLPVRDAQEPNDTPGAASAVALGAPVTLQLQAGDVDWLEVDVPDEGLLTIRFTRYPRPADPQVTVFAPGAAEGEVVAWPTWSAGRHYQAAIPVGKGRHRLRLEDGAGGHDHRLHLELGFHRRAEPDGAFVLVALGGEDAQLDTAAAAGGATVVRPEGDVPPSLVVD